MGVDKRFLAVVGVGLLLAIVFWFLLLSPKRSELSDLDAEAAALSASLDQAEARITAGEEAESHFQRNYSDLVTLGKAVPDGDEQAALMVQLNGLGERTGTQFTTITMNTSEGPTPTVETGGSELDPSQPTVTEPPPADSEDGTTEEPPAETPPATDPAVATEPEVAALPLGAIVGEAEFATLPYQLDFLGDFFTFADLIGSVDRMVTSDAEGRIDVQGRLLTIDGFSLFPGDGPLLDQLAGSFQVTTFVTPAEEGRTAGAGGAP